MEGRGSFIRGGLDVRVGVEGEAFVVRSFVESIRCFVLVGLLRVGSFGD